MCQSGDPGKEWCRPLGNQAIACVNIYKDFYCVCPAGYREENANDGTGSRVCRDINECEGQADNNGVIRWNGGCQHDCFNSAGGFRCECKAGYNKLANDSYHCEDVDECANDKLCKSAQVCINTPGGYRCVQTPQSIKSGDAQGVSGGDGTDNVTFGDQTFDRATLVLGLIIWLILVTIIILFVIACMCVLKKEERRRADYLYAHDYKYSDETINSKPLPVIAYDSQTVIADSWDH